MQLYITQRVLVAYFVLMELKTPVKATLFNSSFIFFCEEHNHAKDSDKAYIWLWNSCCSFSPYFLLTSIALLYLHDLGCHFHQPLRPKSALPYHIHPFFFLGNTCWVSLLMCLPFHFVTFTNLYYNINQFTS